MVTVFSTVLPVILEPIDTPDAMVALCSRPPLERLASALDLLADASILRQWPQILDLYEEFLRWKEEENVEEYLEGGTRKDIVRKHAETLSAFLYSALTHERIAPELRRYLVL
ncbi:MAG: hypothetical protein AB7H88_06925 [Vicinamibacterales bacterium]